MTSGPLTKRDAWAATFEHVLDARDTPRADCPLHLPAAPPPVVVRVRIRVRVMVRVRVGVGSS